ncbi:hypothetical protein SeLEV6574_g06028 [Synchytrium endobioticum]|uniref:Reverse transcriptase domain-containing protein n=1 Tax=Synchytrium endobioticum TaxID=286115 RepID=A0A507CQZ4_9FUNG|nr:hypothetical protein SeLEV6574_g06028 [Synchytrium endobioticum]
MAVLASARIQTSGLSSNAVVTSNPIQSPELTQEEKQGLPPSTWPISELPVVFDMNKQSNLPLPRPGWDFDSIVEYITSEVKSGKLRVSNSPVSSNLFFVPKDDSNTELRPCVDYRDLNTCTRDDQYQLPPIMSLVQDLAGGDWYAKFDWRWAYNNIRIKEGSEWKFAIKYHLGLFEPLAMSFGPKQAPSHMQRSVSESCKDFMEEGWLVNILDNFVIRTVGTIQFHKIHITRYLQRIQELGVCIKLSKCVFFAKEVTFVGFKVNKWGYWKHPEKMETIRKWGVPRSAKDIRKFLGYVSFYRPFASLLSITAKLLYDLTKKNAKWKGEDMEEKSFSDGDQLSLLS